MTTQEELIREEALAKAGGEGNYGLMAEFDSPSAVVAAARRTYAAGYRRINAYSPFPIEELSEAIGYHRDYVAAFTRASQDRFFLCVKSDDPMYKEARTRAFLEGLGAIEVNNVEK